MSGTTSLTISKTGAKFTWKATISIAQIASECSGYEDTMKQAHSAAQRWIKGAAKAITKQIQQAESRRQ